MSSRAHVPVCHRLFVFCLVLLVATQLSTLEDYYDYFQEPRLTSIAASADRQEPQNVARTPPQEPEEEGTTEWWKKPKPLLKDWPYLPDRNAIHPILEKLQYTKGAEIGVQRGLLARRTLRTWKSCKDYKLIDLWGKEDNYQEPGADSNAQKSRHLANARRILEPYKDIVDWYVMRSTDAATKMPESYFDYIYVDARHDYCAVKEDIENYWPKLRPGGIMAGHDFVTASEAKEVLGPLEDWSKCEDGTVNERAVKGAVQDFAAKHNLDITLTHEGFDTWLIQKPYDD